MQQARSSSLGAVGDAADGVFMGAICRNGGTNNVAAMKAIMMA